MNGNTFCFSHAHELAGLGVAPGFDRTTVAEFGSVPFFLAYDHDGLRVAFFAAAPDDDRAGNEHARIEAVLILAADFREIVVDVFEDILEADALGMADDTHLLHGRQGLGEAILDVLEEVLQRGFLGIRVLQKSPVGFIRELVELFLQQFDAVGVLAEEDVPDVGQAVPEPVEAFLCKIIHVCSV